MPDAFELCQGMTQTVLTRAELLPSSPAPQFIVSWLSNVIYSTTAIPADMLSAML